MKWTEIKVKTTTEAVEAVANIFYEIGAQGVVIEDPNDFLYQQKDELSWDYIEEEVFFNGYEGAIVKAYLSEEENVLAKIESIKESVNNLPSFGINIGDGIVELEEVNQQDWENAWKQYYKPVKVSDKIVIKPTWEEYNAKLNELIIQKSKKQIKAPFSGVIVEKNINTNEWLNQGSQVATIVNTQDLEIIFNLPISFINGLKEGDIYDIDISEQTIKAKLYAAIPSGDKLTRTFPVRFKADIKDMFVFDGASAKINFAKETKSEALVINRDAVIKSIISYFQDERNEEIGVIAAGEVLDFFMETLAPKFYNKAIDDTKEIVKKQLESLDFEFDLLKKQ